MGSQLSTKGEQQPPLFSAHVYCGHGRPSQLLLSFCFCLWIKYLGNGWTHLCQIYREDMLGSSLIRVWMSRSKVMVTRDKFPSHWKCIVMRRLQITSCSTIFDHSVTARGDESAELGFVRFMFSKTYLTVVLLFLLLSYWNTSWLNCVLFLFS